MSLFDRLASSSAVRRLGGLAGGLAAAALETKDAATQRASTGRSGFVYANQPYSPPGPDIDRLVRDGYEKVIWAFKAIDAIADKMSDWPIQVMEGYGADQKVVDDDPILPLLNQYSNEIERSAKYFRYRLVSQLILSKRGVFVEVILDRAGRPKALQLLPPGMTSPIPDGDKFLAGFRVETPGMRVPYIDLPEYQPAAPGKAARGGVVWIRKPHPTDPYSSVTPLESAGISLDLDFYARLYNRNFLLNDGRAGQLVAVKGGLSPEDAQELKARFSPGMGGAGRTTVIEADAVSVQDTAISPRDAQYAELRSITKEDLLIALGTPESVIGNASGRTFDNADAEKENWLDVTVLNLAGVVEAGLEVLTRGGYDDERSLKHDVSGEPVLRRRAEAAIDKARGDHAAGRLSVDEFREIASSHGLALKAFDRPGSRVLWVPAGRMPIGAEQDEQDAALMKSQQASAPPVDPAAAGAGGLEGFDAELAALTGGDPTFGQPQADPTAMSGEGLNGFSELVDGLTTAALELGLETKDFELDDLELETKAFNPRQPRYPQGHPQGGQFMDLGDTALWLAGKPLKDGTPPSQVQNPNASSTASPANPAAPGAGGGAARFTQHPNASVRAAAAVVTFPSGYPYARVLGAPPATSVGAAPKPIKAVSLRKGDVVQLSGGKEFSVADAKKGRNGSLDMSFVAADGSVSTMTVQPQQTLPAVARTPHPTKVAQAKRDVAAAARAMTGTPVAPAAGGSTVGPGAPTANVTPPPAPAPAVARPNPAPAAVTPPASAPPAPTTAAPLASSSRAAAVIAAGVETIAVQDAAAGPARAWRVKPGTQGGSNPALVMTDPSGTEHYVKSQTAQIADNEVTSARLYKAAGVQVPTVRRATLSAGMIPGQGGSSGIASEMVAGTSDMTARMRRDPAYRDAVLEDFAVHAWLANWDAVENNNTQTGTNGQPLTIDAGGAGLFRARGGKKTLTGTVAELQSMRGGQAGGTARATFAQLTPDSSDARFVAGVERIAAISPAQIATIVDQGFAHSMTARERADYTKTLVDRRAYLAGQAKVTLPENRTGGSAAAAAAPAAPAAPTPRGPSTRPPSSTTARMAAAGAARTAAAPAPAPAVGPAYVPIPAGSALPGPAAAAAAAAPRAAGRQTWTQIPPAVPAPDPSKQLTGTYLNPTGKTIYTYSDGTMATWKPNGQKGTSSATIAKLQAGHGQWTPVSSTNRASVSLGAAAAAPAAAAPPAPAPGIPVPGLAPGTPGPFNAADITPGAVFTSSAGSQFTIQPNGSALMMSLDPATGQPLPNAIPSPISASQTASVLTGGTGRYWAAGSAVPPAPALAAPRPAAAAPPAPAPAAPRGGPGTGAGAAIANAPTVVGVTAIPARGPVSTGTAAQNAHSSGIGPIFAVVPGTTYVSASGNVLTTAQDGSGVLWSQGGTPPQVLTPSAVSTRLLPPGPGQSSPWRSTMLTAGSGFAAPAPAPAAPGALPAPGSATIPAYRAAPALPQNYRPTAGEVFGDSMGWQLEVHADGSGTEYDSSGNAYPISSTTLDARLNNSGGYRLIGNKTPTASNASSTPTPTPAPAAAAGPVAGLTPAQQQKLGGQTWQSILVPPAGYPYPVVAGAPVATALGAPKQIKVASLRKGDVIQAVRGGSTRDVTIIGTGASGITVVDSNGAQSLISPSAYPQGVMTAVARTPHPQVVAAARAAQNLQGTNAPAAPQFAASTLATARAANARTRAASVAAAQAAITPSTPIPTSGPVTSTNAAAFPVGTRISVGLGLPPAGTVLATRSGDRLTINSSGGDGTLVDSAGNAQQLSYAQVQRELAINAWTVDTLPGGSASAAGAPNVPATAAQGSNVLLTTPAVANGIPASQAARAHGTAQPGGYEPVPGQTYALATGDVLAVHSDGSGTMTTRAGRVTQMTPQDVDIELGAGTNLVPVGPQLTTSAFSLDIGRHGNGNGDTVDVHADGTGTLTLASSGNRTALTDVQVNLLLNPGPTPNAAPGYLFGFQGPAPHRGGMGGASTNTSTAPAAAATPSAPQPAPAGGWGPAGQIVPGARFTNAAGDTLAVGPRGGGQLTLANGTRRNMSAASLASNLNRPGNRWMLAQPGPTAVVAGAGPAATPGVPAGMANTPTGRLFTALTNPGAAALPVLAPGVNPFPGNAAQAAYNAAPASGGSPMVNSNSVYVQNGGNVLVVDASGGATLFMPGSSPTSIGAAQASRLVSVGGGWRDATGQVQVPGAPAPAPAAPAPAAPAPFVPTPGMNPFPTVVAAANAYAVASPNGGRAVALPNRVYANKAGASIVTDASGGGMLYRSNGFGTATLSASQVSRSMASYRDVTAQLGGPAAPAAAPAAPAAPRAARPAGVQMGAGTPGLVAATSGPPALRPAPAASGAPAVPVFLPSVGQVGSQFVGKVQDGQVFRNSRSGNRIKITQSGAEVTDKNGLTSRKTTAQANRMLAAAGVTAVSGPDIDVPGAAHNRAVKQAAKGAAMPPAGTPIAGIVPPNSTFPAAATGAVTPTDVKSIGRGQTVRDADGVDWIITEVDTKGRVPELYGYRPGVDDPTVLTQTSTGGPWRQGHTVPWVRLPGAQTNVVGPAPTQATNVPSSAKARAFDPALGVAGSTPNVGPAGSQFAVEHQNIDADKLNAGDAILVNGKESEGLFVVTRVAPDHAGRPAVYGYSGTAADASGQPGVESKLFLTAPSGSMRQVRVQVNGAVPAPPVVPAPKPPQVSGDIERNDISDPSSKAKLMQLLKGPPPALPSLPTITDAGDRVLGHMMEMRGYNAHPDVVTEAEMDSYVDDGEIEMFRGMTHVMSGRYGSGGVQVDVAEDYRSGRHYPGGDPSAQAMYGAGSYAAYGITNGGGTKEAIRFAQSYAGSGESAVMIRMTIKSDARVVEWLDLKSAFASDRSPEANAIRALRIDATKKLGHYAVLQGYDVIRVGNSYDTTYNRAKPDDWTTGFTVILNRSAVRVSEKNYVPDNVAGRASAGASPPPRRFSDAKQRMNSRRAKHAAGTDTRVVAEP